MFHEIVHCSILDHYPFGEVTLFLLRFFFLDWLQNEFCDISLKMSCFCWCSTTSKQNIYSPVWTSCSKSCISCFFLHNLKTSVLTLKWLRPFFRCFYRLQFFFCWLSYANPACASTLPSGRCTTRPVSALHVYLFVRQTERFLAFQNVGMTSVPAFKEVSMLLCSSHFQLLCQFYFRSTVRCYCRVWRVRVSDNS